MARSHLEKGDTMSQEPIPAPATMDVANELARLRAELTEKQGEIDNLKGRPLHHDPLDKTDDRNDIVQITYTYKVGPNAQEYRQEKLPKYQAVEKLYSYYVNRKDGERSLPKEININGQIVPCNEAPCYVFIRKLNQSGIMREYYKDLPIWILVDRRLNDRLYVESTLIKKIDYDAWLAKESEKENSWLSQGKNWNTTNPNLIQK